MRINNVTRKGKLRSQAQRNRNGAKHISLKVRKSKSSTTAKRTWKLILFASPLTPTNDSGILSPYAELLPETLCSPIMLSTTLPPLSDSALPAYFINIKLSSQFRHDWEYNTKQPFFSFKILGIKHRATHVKTELIFKNSISLT